MEARVGLSSFGQFQNFCYNLLQPVEVSELLKSQTPNTRANCRPVFGGGGGSGGSADPSLRTKGPLFGTSRVKLLRPITING